MHFNVLLKIVDLYIKYEYFDHNKIFINSAIPDKRQDVALLQVLMVSRYEVARRVGGRQHRYRNLVFEFSKGWRFQSNKFRYLLYCYRGSYSVHNNYRQVCGINFTVRMLRDGQLQILLYVAYAYTHVYIVMYTNILSIVLLSLWV